MAHQKSQPLIHQIVLPDVGVCYPQERNKNGLARCRQCGRKMSLRQGFRLEAVRTEHGHTHQGFICVGCLGLEINRTLLWTYAQAKETLRPLSQNSDSNILTGLHLSHHLTGAGLEGMEQAIRNNLHIKSIA